MLPGVWCADAGAVSCFSWNRYMALVQVIKIPHRIHGTGIFTYSGKYASPMDPLGTQGGVG